MSSDSEREHSSDDDEYAPSGGGSESEEENLSKSDPEEDEEGKGLSKEEVDKLWNDFKADVSKPEKSDFIKTDSDEPSKSVGNDDKKDLKEVLKQTSSNEPKECKSEEKTTITVTKIYDFAGEEVKVTKEVDKSSKEAQNHLNLQNSSDAKSSLPLTKMKRPGGGLQGVLGKMGKKPKMSTLEKSRLDWQDYKEKEGIQDELNIHNKGKEGYLEKISFLERTDHRQFEKERDMRLGRTTKR